MINDENTLCWTPLYIVANSLPVPLWAAQCTLVNSMMYKVPVLRIKQAHVSDSKEPIKQSWKQHLFLHVTITSSFWGLRSFHHMLNKFKCSTPVLLLQEVAAYIHTCTHVLTHTLKPSFVKCPLCRVLSQFSVCFIIESDTKRNWLQRRINSAHSPQKGCKNKWPSVAMWIPPPYHFIKMTPDAFFSLWSQSGRCVWLSRAFGGESTSVMCFNKHDLDCSLVLFWSVEMSLLFNSLCWTHSCWQHPGPPNKVQHCDWYWPCHTKHAIFN